MYTYIRVCVRVLDICMCVCVSGGNIFMCVGVGTRVCMRVCVNLYVFLYVCACVRVHTYIADLFSACRVEFCCVDGWW